MQTIQFEITHNISSSKGWGRYKASTAATPKLVFSSTGNEWVSSPKSGDVESGQEVLVTLQRMKRAGKSRREEIYTDTYRLVAADAATATLGHSDGLEVVVTGARIA